MIFDLDWLIKDIFACIMNIKELLKEKGKTKYWLIKNMEGSYQSISHMMNNETTGIKFETIEKLCKLLECTPNDLFKLK
mgnify:CR=1 FL=1